MLLRQLQGPAACSPRTRMPVAAPAYVGQGASNLATEYHEADFSWDEHARACRPKVEQQWRAAAELVQPQVADAVQPSTSGRVYEGDSWDTFCKS